MLPSQRIDKELISLDPLFQHYSRSLCSAQSRKRVPGFHPPSLTPDTLLQSAMPARHLPAMLRNARQASREPLSRGGRRARPPAKRSEAGGLVCG
jgi:hypothetical protein